VRLLRVVLRDYRGVAELELVPAPQGVTVVLGPNEVGKSSIKEALDLVFRFPHDSKHREVLAVKPVHADAGAQVGLELETGPYHFVYEKQFHRSARTVLTVTKPEPESLTGREAHERAEQILSETLDVPLFKALSIAQGQAQEQLALSDQTWISRAFDRAAGGASSGKSEQSLFERAREEFEPYFTANGKEREPLSGPRAQAEALESECGRLGDALAALEADVAETARLAEALRRDEVSLAGERAAKREFDAKLLELAQARERLDSANNDVAAAQCLLDSARDAIEERQKLASAAGAARQHCEELERRRGDQAPAVEDAAEKRNATQREFERLQADATRAREFARACADDETFLRDTVDLGQLRERRAKLGQAQAERAQQQARLGERPLDPKRVDALRKRSIELSVSEAKAAAVAPKLVVRARRQVELVVDGAGHALDEGERLELTGDARRAIELPGAIAIEFEPGADAAAMSAAHARREREWREEVDALGVRDLPEAERRLAEQAEARARIDALTATCAGLLNDLTVEQMDAKIARLEHAVSARGERGADDEALPESKHTARQRKQEAEASSDQAQKLVDAALKAAREAEARASKLEAEQGSLAQRLSSERVDCERAVAALEAARASEGDERLAERAGSAGERLEAARAGAAKALAEVERRQPAALEVEASNKHRVVEDLERRLNEQREKKARVDGRLESQGQEGLAEQRDAAQRKLAVLRGAIARTRRRADAAKLLFETLSSEREDERRAYVRPLAKLIESLGNVVYGPSLRITLADDLSIESRTLGGVTVPFDSLSTGAKEQLGVLARLACAQIVTEDGGVPLILDDVLGHTDPERLERMGAVLALAGKRCQVLLFTSNPERYRGIGGAKFVELTRS
jgi:chromosome segregation ATPase